MRTLLAEFGELHQVPREGDGGVGELFAGRVAGMALVAVSHEVRHHEAALRHCEVEVGGFADECRVHGAGLLQELGHRGVLRLLAEAQDHDHPSMTRPAGIGEVAFDGVELAEEARIGAEGDGFKLGMATLDRLRPTVAAAATGMALRALDESLAYARTRKQFGKPIAEYQLIQQKLARMATELTAARLMLYRAAWEHDQGKERITLGVRGGGPAGLSVFDRKGTHRAGLSVLPDDSPRLEFNDGSGVRRAGLGLAPDGGPALQFEEKGQVRAVLGAALDKMRHKTGVGSLVLFDPDGTVVFQAPVQ